MESRKCAFGQKLSIDEGRCLCGWTSLGHRKWPVVSALLFAFLFVMGEDRAGAHQNSATKSKALLVEAVTFEPLVQGRNVVRITVRNRTRRDQLFGVGIQSRSPEYGNGMGWGSRFAETVVPLKTRDLRFVYHVYGPVTEQTTVSLAFYNPPSAGRYDDPFLMSRRKYAASDLPPASRTDGVEMPLSDGEFEQIAVVLRRTQEAIRTEQYEDAWRSFSADMCAINFCLTLQEFVKNIANPDSRLRKYIWPVEPFLSLQPVERRRLSDGRAFVRGTDGDSGLRVFFVKADGRWLLDDITGYVPKAVTWRTWEARVLPTMKTRSSKHFDLFYAAGSTADRESERIISERELAYDAIQDLFNVNGDLRIRLVFFEDAETKYAETGHQGAGWAFDNTIVEVFGPGHAINPFHEVCHTLTRSLGDPPAILSEGLAVYVSERLGAAALTELGGGVLSVDERVRQIRAEGNYVPLGDLVLRREIGSTQSKPTLTYAEAASFVKFLIEEFGNDKFLSAYKGLEDPVDRQTQQKNLAAMRRIFGSSLPTLERRWLRRLEEDVATAP